MLAFHSGIAIHVSQHARDSAGLLGAGAWGSDSQFVQLDYPREIMSPLQ